MVEDRPDSALVEQAVRGDGDSFTELCRRHYGPMVAIGHAILGDRHLAEDAAQQALAKAAVNLPKLRDAGQFGRWVAAICRNEARDLARARRAERRNTQSQVGQAADVGGIASPDRGQDARDIQGRDGDPKRDISRLGRAPTGEMGPVGTRTHALATQDLEARDAVREALSRLPPDAREVIFLRFYDGLSYDQISAVLGISEQAINGRLRRAKRKLAQYLRRDGFDEVHL
jgi:RNA polymerase sigma-70 factor (ECF subfamily)